MDPASHLLLIPPAGLIKHTSPVWMFSSKHGGNRVFGLLGMVALEHSVICKVLLLCGTSIVEKFPFSISQLDSV